MKTDEIVLFLFFLVVFAKNGFARVFLTWVCAFCSGANMFFPCNAAHRAKNRVTAAANRSFAENLSFFLLFPRGNGFETRNLGTCFTGTQCGMGVWGGSLRRRFGVRTLDKFGKRFIIIRCGYGLSAAVRCLFACAQADLSEL